MQDQIVGKMLEMGAQGSSPGNLNWGRKYCTDESDLGYAELGSNSNGSKEAWQSVR